MIPLSTAAATATSGTLTWTKISCNRHYELRQNGAVVGTLTRPSIWSQKFVAETPEGRWTFRRSGFWRNDAEIVDASGHVIASGKLGYGRGTLTFADSQSFQLTHKGWWRPVWTLATNGGRPLLYIHVREKTVDLAGPVPDDRLSLLTLFAWYRILQAEEDAAGAAVMVAVGT